MVDAGKIKVSFSVTKKARPLGLALDSVSEASPSANMDVDKGAGEAEVADVAKDKKEPKQESEKNSNPKPETHSKSKKKRKKEKRRRSSGSRRRSRSSSRSSSNSRSPSRSPSSPERTPRSRSRSVSPRSSRHRSRRRSRSPTPPRHRRSSRSPPSSRRSSRRSPPRHGRHRSPARRHHSRSPRRYSRSPRRFSRSPRRYSRSPRRYSRSPRRYSRSPRRYSRSPRRNSTGHRQHRGRNSNYRNKSPQRRRSIRSPPPQPQRQISEASNTKNPSPPPNNTEIHPTPPSPDPVASTKEKPSPARLSWSPSSGLEPTKSETKTDKENSTNSSVSNGKLPMRTNTLAKVALQVKSGKKEPTTPTKAASNLPSSENNQRIWRSGCVNQFQKIAKVGEGTYGEVFKAKHRETGELVALKKVRMENEKEGFPITAVREIKILKTLNHSSIVSLKGIVTDAEHPVELMKSKGAFYMVFEYMQHDLTGILEGGLVKLTSQNIRGLMRSLVEGLLYCHGKNMLHRDIKASNLLLNSNGQLKIADFGLARRYDADEERAYTNRVITLWYRPPELLLGNEKYGPEVDVWSSGCILGELFSKKPIFRAENELDQLDTIARVCGSPTKLIWPSVEECPLYGKMMLKRTYPRVLADHFRNKYPIMPPEAIDLLDKMLILDPTKRISTSAILEHPYLTPSECAPFKIQIEQDCHEMWIKQGRRKAKEQARIRNEKSDGGKKASSTNGPEWICNCGNKNRADRDVCEMKYCNRTRSANVPPPSHPYLPQSKPVPPPPPLTMVPPQAQQQMTTKPPPHGI
eukprot:m.143759 g.143759  ORF g.143759 m.143759 type:complete len:803 (-) comp14905_c0_seq3:2834-5242(-)